MADSSGAIELGGGSSSGGAQFEELDTPLADKVRQAFVDRIKSNHVLTFAGLQLQAVEVAYSHVHVPQGVQEGIYMLRFVARGILLGQENNVYVQTMIGMHVPPVEDLDSIIVALANGLRDQRRKQGGQLNGSS